MAKPASRLGRGLGSLIAGGTSPKVETPLSGHPDLQKKSTDKPANISPVPAKRPLMEEIGKENLLQVPVDSLVPNPYQPRKVI